MAPLDVQNAFDSVNHEMLCENIRLSGIEPDWCISYLAARKQMVCVGESYSSSETITCGVPQGSVLGPWCYLMYSNDIASSVSCKLLMYADDTVGLLLVSDKDINTVSVQLDNEVTNSYNWLLNNKLSMHMGKTECIVFSSKKKKHLTKDFSMKCHTHNVCASNQVTQNKVVRFILNKPPRQHWPT